MGCYRCQQVTGDSFSVIDHEAAIVRGYTRCGCGDQVRLIYELDYHPNPLDYAAVSRARRAVAAELAARK